MRRDERQNSQGKYRRVYFCVYGVGKRFSLLISDQ